MVATPRPAPMWIGRTGFCLLAIVGSIAFVTPLPLQAQTPSSEAIQKARDEAERQKADYRTEKARVDHVNERVRLYKELMAKIPFEPVPGTNNMVQVFMNGHDLRNTARRIYDVSDEATDAGFDRSYWPTVMWLNRAKDYHTGMPQYGKLDPQTPENNVALFPNVKKQGYKAVVAPITSEDSAMAQQMTAPVVNIYKERLRTDVDQLATRGGSVYEPEGPKKLPGENHVALFQATQSEPLEEYPPRRLTAPSEYVSTDPVPVDRVAPLEPAPPAWALRQGVNMLGPNYEGYNMQYQPNKFDLAPEFAPIAMFGGRDHDGNPRTQPGFHFGLNQRFFKYLRVNESAFVAFAAGDAPPMNGGSIGAGLGTDIGGWVDISGIVGVAAVNVIGGVEWGPHATGKLRVPVTEHLQAIGLYKYTNITSYRVEDESGGHTGVSNASYLGLGVIVR